MKTFHTMIAAGVFVLVPITAVQATVIGVTNGNFEAQPLDDLGQAQAITSWFENSTSANYRDWLTKNSTQFVAPHTNVLGFSGAPGVGFIYQQIGTFTANEIVRVSGTAEKRSGAGGLWGAITVSLLSGNFAGADGTPLSATLLASASFTAAGLGLPNNLTAATAPFSADLNSGTSGVNGQPLWLLITPNNPANTETFLDNIQAVAIPEPSGLVLLIVGSIGFVAARRRRARLAC